MQYKFPESQVTPQCASTLNGLKPQNMNFAMIKSEKSCNSSYFN